MAAFNELTTQQQEAKIAQLKNAGWTQDQIDRAIKNPYYNEYLGSGYESAISKAAGTTDPTAINEIYKRYVASGKDFGEFMNEVAVDPASYSKQLTNITAKKEAEDIATPLIQGIETSPGVFSGGLKQELGEKETEARGYLDRLLASRGIGQSGAVGAKYTDLAGQYAKALGSGIASIKTAASDTARSRGLANYDKALANQYSEKINQQYMDAIKQYQQSQQPTFWDYASTAIGAIPGIGGAYNAVSDIISGTRRDIFGNPIK